MSDSQWVVMTNGERGRGLMVVGPFPTRDDAVDWMTAAETADPTRVLMPPMELEPPR